MKRLLSSLSLAVFSFSIVGCVDMDPGYGAGYGAPARPVYGPGYESSPSTYYARGSNDQRRDYDRPAPNRSTESNYYGGPTEWYKSGIGLGRRDRKERLSPSYRRHQSQYDGRTEREFARGYNDGYNGR